MVLLLASSVLKSMIYRVSLRNPVSFFSFWFLCGGYLNLNPYVASAFDASTFCWKGWTFNANSFTCMKVFDNEKTWDAANARCKRVNGKLVEKGDERYEEELYDSARHPRECMGMTLREKDMVFFINKCKFICERPI
ncbi:hypothetical protein EGW08_023622, partial [Elysia chlorotica]